MQRREPVARAGDEPSVKDTTSADLKARAAGLALVGIAVVLLKLDYFDVIRDAEAGVPSVDASSKALVLTPACLVFGLVLLLTGAPRDLATGFGRHFMVGERPQRKVTPLGWALVAALALPGLGLYLWMMSHLHELGYQQR
jgi:hypothetical protein